MVATDADNDTLTYTLGGADAASFDINRVTGQIMTFAALDFEAKASYTVDVTATDDGRESDTIAVTINVTEVNEAPEFDSTTATRSVAENTAAGENIGDPVAATDADTGDMLTYTLGGDGASFDIDSTGQLMTKDALDFETKASYSVTVAASDGKDSATVTVTVTVTNVDEMGMVTLSAMQPTVGVELTAMLSDDDMAVEHMATVTWQWASSSDMDGTYTNIVDDATSASYTPVDGDANMYLRATAMYTDGYGADKSEMAVSANMVVGLLISDMSNVEYAENGAEMVATYTASGPRTWLPGRLRATDAEDFEISSGGVLTFVSAPDYEAKSTYMVTVKADDGTYMDTQRDRHGDQRGRGRDGGVVDGSSPRVGTAS